MATGATEKPVLSRLSFAGLILDLDGHGLARASGEDIPLTPSEFALLATLVASPGRALSRDFLLQAVAGRESESFDRSVDVLVGRLRRKIEPDPKNPRLIATMPGVGYKFAETPRAAPATAALPEGAGAEPDRPSLAVLPFANLSGDPEQDYFADGMVEEITNALSRVRWFFTIARNSSFTYKGRAVDVKQVGRELGVRYVLEGSVRKAAGRVRITAQLVETETGAHVWADRFEGTIEDIFDLQDSVAASVVAAIEPRLRDVELARADRQRPSNPTAYDCFLRGLAQFYTDTREGSETTLRLMRRAIESDPAYAVPYALASQCLVYRLSAFWSEDRDAERREGLCLAEAALVRGRDDPTVLALVAHAIAYIANDFARAHALIERSLALNPNSALALQLGGWILVYMECLDRAIEWLTRGMRLSPLDIRDFVSFSALASCYIRLGQDEEAIAWARRSTASNSAWQPGLLVLASALAHLGRLNEARAVADRIMAVSPTFRLSDFMRLLPATPGRDRYTEGLRLAGLPE